MELALEALESAVRYHGIMLMSDPPQDAWKYHRVENKADKAIAAIKEALAQPEQEPVAWAMLHDNGDFIDAINLEEHARVEGQYKHPLYTTPPQRKPLTNEQINEIADEFIVNYRIPAGSQYDFVRAIEAAHGIKGEA